MNISVTRTNLLILKGVSVGDFTAVDILCGTRPRPRQEEAVDAWATIPTRFTSVATWPTHTNLRCWSCSRFPVGYPKFIALNPSVDADGNEVCDAWGNFCKWNCAARIINIEFPPNQRPDLHRALCRFESKFTGHRREKIMPAPPPYLMREYAGANGLTQTEYEARVTALDKDYDLSAYKMEHFSASKRLTG